MRYSRDSHPMLWRALVATLLAATAYAQPPAIPGDDGDIPAGFGDAGFDASGGLAGFGQEASDEPVRVKAKLVRAKEGRTGQLVITATIGEGWHIYSLTQPKGGPQATQIKLEPSDAYTLTGPFRATTEPKRHKDTEIWLGLTLEEHFGQVTWIAPVEFTQPVAGQPPVARGVVDMQPCNSSGCLPTVVQFSAEAVVGPLIPLQKPNEPATTQSQPSTNLSDQTDRSPGAHVARSPESASVSMPATTPTTTPAAGENDQSLAWMLLLGFAGGILLNVMPCVLPVIGLKVFAFIEQAGESRAKTFALNFWYSLGVISIFMVLALLAVVFQFGWGQLFQLKEFNIAMAAVIFAMGLSFIGVWEIPIPGFIGTSKVTDIGEREGYEGAFAKGTITTLLATPCTGPFMGAAIAGVVSRPAPEIFAIFFSIGLGMSTPYLIIGAFPELVRFLPKPGEWMNTFKEVMGFVLLGTVAFILTSLRPYHYVVPTIAFLFGIWFCCWWIGRVPATAESDRRWRALGEATLIGVISGLISFGWLSPIMQERHEEIVEQMADAQLEKWADAGLISYFVRNEPWQPYTEMKLEWLETANKTVIVDFTADWCQTCKALEKFVLKTDATSKLIKELGIYTLVADWTEREAAVETDRKLKELGVQQVPVLVIYPAGQHDQPIKFVDTYTTDQLHKALRKAGKAKRKSARVATRE